MSYFVEQDSGNNPQSSGRYGTPACAIDSADVIRIVYGDDNATTPALRYVTFDTSTNTFSGDSSVVADLGSDMTAVSNIHCSIAIDRSDYVHLAFVGYTPNMGTDYYTVYYTNNVSGSFKTAVQVEGTTAQKQCRFPVITMDKDDYPYIAYVNESDNDVTVAIGNANNATSFTLYDVETDNYQTSRDNTVSVAVDDAGDHYVAYKTQTNGYVYINRHAYGGGWTTWTGRVTNSNVGTNPSLVIIGLDRYVFYLEDGSSAMAYDRYSGTFGSGSWLGETILETTSDSTPRARWAYTNNLAYNANYAMDYVYKTGNHIWYNSKDFPRKRFYVSSGA